MIQLSRRTIALALAAFLAFAGLAAVSFVRTLAPAEAGAGFSDTPPWIAAHADWLQDNGIADGFPDGTFGPNNNITRGQNAYWLGNYNDSIEIVMEEIDPAAGNAFTRKATCPAGKRAVAGGGRSSGNLIMTDSYPVDADAWLVRWGTDDNAIIDPSFVRAWALCVPETINL